jgi:drug/metabolite transporter (DMT)-like permease
MSLGDLQRLLLLSAIWGASFIFFRVIVPVLGPVVTVELRVLIAGIALLIYASIVRAKLEWRERWPWYAIIGITNSAVPFALIAYSEVRLTASLASILNASTPLFTAILAAIFFRDPLTSRKILGLVLGFAGVVVLVGWSPLKSDLTTYLSVAAMLGATFFYGLSSNLTRLKLKGAPPLGAAVGSQLASSLALLPLVPFNPAPATPDLTVLLCLLGLALVCTAFAYILFFRLILETGATRASTVTFIVPVFGVLWGALFLHEPVGLEKILACTIILIGASLVTGLNLNSFRSAPNAQPQTPKP